MGFCRPAAEIWAIFGPSRDGVGDVSSAAAAPPSRRAASLVSGTDKEDTSGGPATSLASALQPVGRSDQAARQPTGFALGVKALKRRLRQAGDCD